MTYETFLKLYESLETKKEIPTISYQAARLNAIHASFTVLNTLVKAYKKYNYVDAEHIIKITSN